MYDMVLDAFMFDNTEHYQPGNVEELRGHAFSVRRQERDSVRQGGR